MKRQIEEKKRILLQNQGVNMVFSNVKGSDIGVISKIVSEYEISDYYLKNIIPQDKEILSMQLIPHRVIYEKVNEWLLVIVYRK